MSSLIHLTTFISAPAERVYDLARSVELHKESMKTYGEDAVSGTRVGMLEKDDLVTWQARHLFKKRMLRVKVTEMSRPVSFITEQSEGDFKQMKHERHFKPCDNGTILIDLFHYEPPYGAIGRWINKIYLQRYIRRLLEQHNKTIKEFAESEKWKKLLLK